MTTHIATDAAIGMVDSLTQQDWAPTEEELEFARAYLADGPMDSNVLARLQARMAEREQAKTNRLAQDWGGLGRHRAANAAVAGQPIDVVFIGDSITEMWQIAQPDLFSGGVVSRGISGQTSPQILLRFMPDVVCLQPRAVHLMCGVNDIAGNTGPTTAADYRNNILAMVDLAQVHGIQVILAGLTPVTAFSWAPEIRSPKARVDELNAWLADLARDRGLVQADYHSVLAANDGAFQSDLTRDGVHPVLAGYQAMRPVCDRAIAEALT